MTFCDEYLSDWVGGRFIVSLRTEFFAHLHGLSLAFFDRQRLWGRDDPRHRRRGGDRGPHAQRAGLGAVATSSSSSSSPRRSSTWTGSSRSSRSSSCRCSGSRRGTSRARSRRAAREERRRSGSIGAVAEESLSNAALVQAYNRKDEEVARFHRENEGSFAAQMAATRLSSLFSPLINMIELAGVIVVVAFGAYQLSQGRLTVGGLLVFMVFLGQLYGPIRGVSSLLNSFYSASAGAERVIEFLDERPSVTEQRGRRRTCPAPRAASSSTRSPSAIPARRAPALEDVSFSRRPRRDARARRAERGRQVHGREALAPLLRPGRGHDPARRPRPARPDARGPCARTSPCSCRRRSSSTGRSGRTSPTAGRAPRTRR